jgi:hypothetical protein
MTCEVVRRSRHAETAEIIRAGEGPPFEQRHIDIAAMYDNELRVLRNCA